MLFSCLYNVSLAQVGNCPPSIGEAYLDINNVRARIPNNGALFYNGSPHVYNIPKFSPTNAFFASGILIAGLVDGELRGSAARYAQWEFWPGPLDETGNPPADCSKYDRVYKINLSDLIAFEETGTLTADISEWPWQLGAPVVDGDGIPNNYDLAAGDRPKIEGHQTLWWVMNDRGNQHKSSNMEPIGLEVQVTAFALASRENPSINNSTFYRYLLINKSTSRLEEAFFGLFADPDLGDWVDDYVGSDSLLNLGYVYNSDNEDAGSQGYGTPPPAAGISFLQGPRTNSDSVDNDRDGTVDERDERAQLHSFVFYYGGGGIAGDPVTGSDYYLYMQGRWKDTRPILYGGDGFLGAISDQPSPIMYAGDPVTREGWSERNPGVTGTLPPNQAGDRRFMQATGPFSIAPGDSQEVVFAVVWAQGEDNWDSVTALKNTTRDIQMAFAEGLQVPFPEPDISTNLRLEAPANHVLQQPLNPTLQWQYEPLATYYEVQWGKNGLLSESELVTNEENTSLRLPTLEPFTTYSWRVRAGNTFGIGPWSKLFRFSTSDAIIEERISPIQGFMAVQNASGVIDPYDMAAFGFNTSGFPIIQGVITPLDSYPEFDRPTVGVQQSLSDAVWGFHAGRSTLEFANPTPCEDCEEAFIDRAIQNGWNTIGFDDYEWRFTQACLDHIDGSIEENDCLAQRTTDDPSDTGQLAIIEVPFEIWNIGDPEVPGDDYRMIPLVCEEACSAGNEPNVFDIAGDHSISSAMNDPYTDEVSWFKPADNGAAPGEQGYVDYFFQESELGEETFSHLVLVNWNGGEMPPYEIPLPEPGSTFRITTAPLPIPIPSAPGDGAFTSQFETPLYWQASASFFRIQVSTSPTFATVLLDLTDVQGSSLTLRDLDPNIPHYWRVRVEAGLSIFSDWSPTWQFTPLVSGVANEEEDQGFPEAFELGQNYPNPSQSVTTIEYALPYESEVDLSIFDVLGRRVLRLVLKRQNAGRHEVTANLITLPAGVYYYRLMTESQSLTRSLVILK